MNRSEHYLLSEKSPPGATGVSSDSSAQVDGASRHAREVLPARLKKLHLTGYANLRSADDTEVEHRTNDLRIMKAPLPMNEQIVRNTNAVFIIPPVAVRGTFPALAYCTGIDC